MKIYKRKMKVLCSMLLIVCIGSLSISACNPRGDNDLQQEHTNTYLTDDELDGYKQWVNEQENFTKSHQELLSKADDRIELLEENVDNLSTEKKQMVRENVEHLKLSRNALEDRLSQLKQANEQNWAELKQEVQGAADSLNTYMENLDKNVEFGAI